LLGEDETQPKNRLVLICNSCRLVNGQAPPGVKSLEELGRWRCGSCGAWNGVESEAKKVLAGIRNEPLSADAAWEPVSKPDAENQSLVSDSPDEGVMVATSEDDQVESHDSDAESADKEQETQSEEQPQPETKGKSLRRSNRKKA
jgi:hypothetical protein